ncbi:uncharacterized protein LOC119589657 [Penaeus monodon]|uniref:uncharacterized protein LOC119589656 n=1 Tax=Penaeus monodon TaxID=6687 RepID=UPI0018A6E6AD|nr:uncharacterized protein LOC119589656 [Penaeus monodon]XP_037794181.1 uncharacterized protein LOC119589657 [Penaeus monodon]
MVYSGFSDAIALCNYSDDKDIIEVEVMYASDKDREYIPHIDEESGDDDEDERKVTDKFAATRNIFDIFNGNCQKLNSRGETLTVDEQLLRPRVNYPFRVYIPSKPVNYGLILIMVCDNRSKYMLNAAPCLGKEQSRPVGNMTLGHYYTKHLRSLSPYEPKRGN